MTDAEPSDGKSKVIFFYAPRSLYLRIKEKASARNISLSRLMRELMEDLLRREDEKLNHDQ